MRRRECDGVGVSILSRLRLTDTENCGGTIVGEARRRLFVSSHLIVESIGSMNEKVPRLTELASCAG